MDAALLLIVSLLACGGDDGVAQDAGPDAARDAGEAVETIVPPELADEEAFAEMAAWEAISVLGDGVYRQQASTDRMSGAPAPTPFVDRGNRDMNHFVCRSDDAVVGSSHLVEPLYDLSVCPEAYVKGVVLSRFEGSGRLARLWMTLFSIREQAPDDEVLRIYVDDATEPVVQVPLAEALLGTADEMLAWPFVTAGRTRLVWHYPVVFGSRLIVTLDRLGDLDLYYHQTDVVLDASPRARTPAAEPLPIGNDVRALLAIGPPLAGEPVEAPLDLAPGETATALTRTSAGTIHSLRVAFTDAVAPLLDDVRLVVTWDGAASPAIDAPLSLVLGTAPATPAMNGFALRGAESSAERFSELRLPMPFTGGATVALTNDAVSSVSLTLRAMVSDTPPPAGAGRLHARVNDTDAAGPSPHPLADVAGRGRLVGTCLYLEGHAGADAGIFASPFNFLEGDETGTIDGVPIAGTGTEDYLDGAFYFEEGEFATPWAQVWGLASDGTNGRVSGCRWHVLGDAIDFQTSLSYSLEIGPGDPDVRDRYRSITWLYLEP